jgi:hypothetical protein
VIRDWYCDRTDTIRKLQEQAPIQGNSPHEMRKLRGFDVIALEER